MTQRLGHLLLFLLLVGDWAGDPHFGHSPFSRPMSSQEVYCHTFSCGKAACLSKMPLRDAGHTGPVSVDFASTPALTGIRPVAPPSSASCPGSTPPLRC
jgi:hypothetical protein